MFGRINSILVFYITALLLAPLGPLQSLTDWINNFIPSDRFFFVPWAGFSFLLSCCAYRFSSSTGTTILPQYSETTKKTCMASILSILTIVSFYNSKKYIDQIVDPRTLEFDTSANFMLNNDSDSAYIPGHHTERFLWFYSGLLAIHPHMGQTNEPPNPIVDPFYLNEDISTVHVYSADCGCVQEASAEMLEQFRQSVGDLREAPLNIALQAGQTQLSWQLGPYEAGEYRIVSPILGSSPLPIKGSLMYNRHMLKEFNHPFILRYTSPEGWTTYSPELSLPLQEGDAPVALSWERL